MGSLLTPIFEREKHNQGLKKDQKTRAFLTKNLAEQH
jgi:hypothetical protein